MGSNIVSTHALFLKFDNEIMDLIQLQGYILILDEVVEVARQMDEIKGKGYTKSYLACNARATNAYIDRTAIAYMCNRYFNPILKNFFIMQGVRVEEEAWALSELLQFLFRSAIREGNKITVYIPSSRMRRLLENWMNKGPIYSIDK